MDLKLLDAEPSAEEREAVDLVLGLPTSAWDGGARGSEVDYHSAIGGRAVRERRPELVPALQALQARVGWISEGGLNYVCTRLGVPPAEAWGVATFYALLATSPRPRRVLHVCDDVACRGRGSGELCERLERAAGPALGHAPHGDAVQLDAGRPAWMRSPCLGICDHAPAALVTEAGERPLERLLGGVTAERALAVLGGADPGPDGSEVQVVAVEATMGAAPTGCPPHSNHNAASEADHHRADATVVSRVPA